MPVKLSEAGNWLHPARLPLGAGWDGHCTAPGHEGTNPDPAVLRDGCNLGYARCPNLASERPWDAIRFAVAGEETPQIVLSFACERAHRPAGHGQLRFDTSSGTWLLTNPDPRIQHMAECFLQSHLARVGRRAAAAGNVL